VALNDDTPYECEVIYIVSCTAAQGQNRAGLHCVH